MRNRETLRSRWSWLLSLVVLAPLLVACGSGGGSANTDDDAIARNDATTSAETQAVDPAPTEPISNLGMTDVIPVRLSTDEIQQIKPNELGRIPILMYHAFTTDPKFLDEWTVTTDQFRAHLQWLYDHDFYVVPLADLVNNEISAPPGKHPVVLTFDDASSGQFRLLKDDQGAFYPDPITAVGIMEEFFAAHPDFGHTALFAVVPTTCFQKSGEVSTCEERLTWLAENGYEIANHTWWHQDLSQANDELLMQQIGETKIWIDERVTGAANLSSVLVLPFGAFPSYDWQMDYLYSGFVWGGQTIQLSAVVLVGGGPASSPSSGPWTRWAIPRFNTDPEGWGHWTETMNSPEYALYTSDGNPGTVTIPDPIPEDIAAQYDAEWASDYGMQVIRYTPGAAGGDGEGESGHGLPVPVAHTGRRQ